jgi:hypothetical protein
MKMPIVSHRRMQHAKEFNSHLNAIFMLGEVPGHRIGWDVFGDRLDGKLHQGCRVTTCRSKNHQPLGTLEQLGRPLFVRNKAGASLAPAEQQFLRFAPSFVKLWPRAPASGRASRKSRGAWRRVARSLWQSVSLAQLGSADATFILEHCSSRSCRCSQDLITHVAGGIVDIAYAPQHRP